jgi:mono/diheme cytochrome c family protein
MALSAGCAAVACPSRAADNRHGEQLARRWCSSCHVIGEVPKGSVQQGPPSFRSVTEQGLTSRQLQAFLSHPHGSMPDLSLTRGEIDDLIGYIESLR